MITPKKIEVTEICVSISNQETSNLFEDVFSDIPLYAFKACKLCYQQAGSAPMQNLSNAIDTYMDGIIALLGEVVDEPSSSAQTVNLNVFHPVAYKLKNVIEAFDRIRSHGRVDSRVVLAEESAINLKTALIKLSDNSQEHNWDAKSVTEKLFVSSSHNSGLTH